MTGYGITQVDICAVLDIDLKTLRLHYRHELDTAKPEANAQVAQALFVNATKHKNVTAQIWWTKTQMGWKETVINENVGKDGGPIQTAAAVALTNDPIEAAKLWQKMVNGDKEE